MQTKKFLVAVIPIPNDSENVLDGINRNLSSGNPVLLGSVYSIGGEVGKEVDPNLLRHLVNKGIEYIQNNLDSELDNLLGAFGDEE